jgi:hypothetical protein
MTRGAREFHEHAQAVLDGELRRARGRLCMLPQPERAVVEQVCVHVSAALVDGLLEHARVDRHVAQALASIYDSPIPPPDVRAVSFAPD